MTQWNKAEDKFAQTARSNPGKFINQLNDAAKCPFAIKSSLVHVLYIEIPQAGYILNVVYSYCMVLISRCGNR